MAVISGMISILYAVATITSSRITTGKFDDTIQELYELTLICGDFSDPLKKNRSYKKNVYVLQKELARLLRIEPSMCELHPPIKIEQGLKLRFTLTVNKSGGGHAVHKQLQNLIAERELSEKIKSAWQLTHYPMIYDLKWHKDRRTIYFVCTDFFHNFCLYIFLFFCKGESMKQT